MKETVLDISNRISSERDALANPLRVIILAIIMASKNISWTELNANLEKITEKRLNSNSVNFHLSRLVKAGLVSKTDHRYKPTVAPQKINEDFANLVSKLNKEVPK